MINIFLDDQRVEPIGWVRTKTVDETILILEAHQGEIDILSLDHDLGACNVCLKEHGGSIDSWLARSHYTEMPNCDHFGTGYDVALFLEEKAYNDPNFIFPKRVQCHSANPVGREKIEHVIRKLKNMDKIA